MVFFALGALSYRAEHLQLELDALKQEQKMFGGAIRGAESLASIQERATDRHAALVELMPYGTPQDWVAVGSAAIFSEYYRKVLEVGPRLRADFDESEAPELLARMQAICVHAAPPFDADKVPAFTPDPKDDPIVYSALLGGADILVSDDRDIVPKLDRPVKFYEHGEASLAAMTFDHFVTDCLADVDWDEIDGKWLVEAFK